MKSVLLGSWRTRTGNGCDVYLLAGPGPSRELSVDWDRLPLSAPDKIDYLTRILPAIERRAREYLELHGQSLVVVLG